MSFLFEPVSAAIQTLKHIKSASDKGPDPERFIVRLPMHPGKLALGAAFKRKHNLWKWTHFRPSKVPRKRKFKIGQKKRNVRHEIDETPEAAEAGQATADLDTPVAGAPSAPTQDDVTGSGSGSALQSSQDQDTESVQRHSKTARVSIIPDDDMPYFPIPDEEERENEVKRIAEMSPEQRVYHRSCEHYKVKPLRQIMKQIDTKEIILAHTKMKDTEFKAFSTALVMNFTVRRVDMSDTMPTEQQTTYLTDLLEDDNGITDLIFKDNHLEGRLMSRIFYSMRQKDIMIYLDIS
ncbi:hypothetical protein EGW08_010898, partial [Elysia chlorotica]